MKKNIHDVGVPKNIEFLEQAALKVDGEYLRITQDASARILYDITPSKFEGLYTDEIETCLVLLLRGRLGISMIHMSGKTDPAHIAQEFRELGELNQWCIAYNSGYHEDRNSFLFPLGAIFEKLSQEEKGKMNREMIDVNPLSDDSNNQKAGSLSINRNFEIQNNKPPKIIFEPSHIFDYTDNKKANARNIIYKVNNFFLSSNEFIKLDVQFNGQVFSPLFLNKTIYEINELIKNEPFTTNRYLTETVLLMRKCVLNFYKNRPPVEEIMVNQENLVDHRMEL